MQDNPDSLPKYENLMEVMTKGKKNLEEAFEEGKKLIIKDAICATSNTHT